VLTDWVILTAAFLYLGTLFGIAYYGAWRADSGRSIIANPYIYTLSIAVYCTAWTFYGSVGRAATTGVGFLPIYLGPTLMAALWWFVIRKIVRITRHQHITSIADFIASRYGKSALLGGLVTIIAVIGILPYISLQLKAISTSYLILREYPSLVMPSNSGVYAQWEDTALFAALFLAAFAIAFGTRHIDATEHHEGMVAAIAFESLVKLFAFLTVGVFVTFTLFDGPGDLFTQAAADPRLADLMSLKGIQPGGWLFLTLLSMLAIVFLPRQFQVTVIENVDEQHIQKAMWLFPLYLLIINLFVLPLAFGGSLLFPNGNVDPDTYVLTIPMAQQQEGLALFVFLGGLSAATGMVIVATIALSTMVSNDLLMPVLLRIRALKLTQRQDLSGLILGIRRITIILILLLGYLYFRLIGESYALVTIGLVSFTAAAQFAPAILLGIYWQGATRLGAISGLSAGFLVWAYTLLLPAFAKSGWLPAAFLDQGAFGIALLRPYQLFGLDGLDVISHSVFWSLLANAGLLVLISLFSRPSPIERFQANLFTNALASGLEDPAMQIWKGQATVAELRILANRFMGPQQVANALKDFEHQYNMVLDPQSIANPALVSFVERLLAGAIGTASARVMVASVAEGETLNIEGVMEILDETSQTLEYSHRLEEKSRLLEVATTDLRTANERLQKLDQLKDEFVSTVSHEFRTPLTSIRAFSEILKDNPAMEIDQRQGFLDIVVKETERLTRLINEVLDLDKIESGHMVWKMADTDLRQVLIDAMDAVSQLFKKRAITLESDLPATPAPVNIDSDRMIQVIINLLSNAGKFCESESGWVTVRLALVEDAYRITVQDNGPGIPADQCERIFEKFHQVSDVQQGKPKGTGLGLAISERIVRYHGGQIHVESVIGAGTTFVITLPGEPAH